MLCNGRHVLGNGPHMLGNRPHWCTKFIIRLFILIMGRLGSGPHVFVTACAIVHGPQMLGKESHMLGNGPHV